MEPVFQKRLHHQAHLGAIGIPGCLCIDVIMRRIDPVRTAQQLKWLEGICVLDEIPEKNLFSDYPASGKHSNITEALSVGAAL